MGQEQIQKIVDLISKELDHGQKSERFAGQQHYGQFSTDSNAGTLQNVGSGRSSAFTPTS